jgi:hypothetical protein
MLRSQLAFYEKHIETNTVLVYLALAMPATGSNPTN